MNEQVTNLPEVYNSGDLTVAREPQIVLAEARKAAEALSDVIKNKKKPVIFNGEQYLEFEDWQTVGRFYGITAKVTSTNPISIGEINGYEARAVAINVATGEEVSAADSQCMQDERNWKDKPLFQLRSMAQTRACAKALRNVLSWVVVLAGYKATPAEEMEQNHETPAPAAPKATNMKPPKSTKPEPEPEPKPDGAGGDAVYISMVTTKAGTNKNGEPWTRYSVKIGDDWYSTFDSIIGAEAIEAKNNHLLVEFTYTQNGDFRNIDTLTIVEAAAK